MARLDLILLVLLGTALVFSLIELGLSATAVHALSYRYYYTQVPGSGYTANSRRVTPPATFNFLLFTSVWSTLVSALLLAVPFLFKKRASANDRILGFGSLILNTITMIFWLSGFAALSAFYGGEPLIDTLGALLAFGVMLWLIFLALTILNFLTAFGVLKSYRAGHHAMFRGHGGPAASTPMTTLDGPKV